MNASHRCFYRLRAQPDLYRENDCRWRTSNQNTSLTQFQLDKRSPYGALNTCGVGLVLSTYTRVGSRNHGNVVLIHHGKRHYTYAFILDWLMLFSGVPRCGQLGCAALFKVSKGAKIRNQYNQVPHLTQDTNGKVTNSQ